jgi:hypothetical protein
MKNITYSVLLTFLIFITILLLSCNSSDNKKQQKKSVVTFKFLKYSSGNIKEKYGYENGVLNSINYLEDNGTIDSIGTYHYGKLSSKIKYSYYEDGTLNADTYKENKLIVHMVFDSLINLLYQTPLDIPKVTHTTYKFRSGRTYFDPTKIDTIEIINNDIPPYNKAYTILGANLVPVNHLGVFAITNYQKKKAPDSLIIWISVSENISLEKPIRKTIDSIIIPIK